MLHILLDALFPKKSLDGREGEWVTPSERAQMQSFPIVESATQLRAHGIHHLDRLVSGSNYRQCPLLKNAIWTFKFRRVPALGEELARIMLASCSHMSSFDTPRHVTLRRPEFQRRPYRSATGAATQDDMLAAGSVFVPVPLHWTRRFWRGFNQSEFLARRISEQCAIPVEHCLSRIRPTGFQSHRRRSERLTALDGAFRSVGTVPERVILVDDVATTGATLDACAKTLKAAGAQWVEGWVVARG